MDAINRETGLEHIALTVNMLWRLWKTRNNMQFQEKDRSFVQAVNQEWSEWIEFNCLNRRDQRRNIAQTRHEGESHYKTTIEQNMIILATTAKIQIHHSKNGYGIDAGKHGNHIKIAWALTENKEGVKKIEEAKAIKLPLIKAKETGWLRVAIRY
ncbi:hypothetical protein ACH5RR_028747 [Cinchona calisaya]|uniref:Uncharacterized protein n=1 Tax=Cinchona calisaya TaxID=153742 RepID=A0ABD2YPN9_9GENT